MELTNLNNGTDQLRIGEPRMTQDTGGVTVYSVVGLPGRLAADVRWFDAGTQRWQFIVYELPSTTKWQSGPDFKTKEEALQGLQKWLNKSLEIAEFLEGFGEVHALEISGQRVIVVDPYLNFKSPTEFSPAEVRSATNANVIGRAYLGGSDRELYTARPLPIKEQNL